uniref:Uncharacterized protein n=2 Tax=Araucaria cunninghamii TaxID=56994 RepID=A0A0D6QX23_ARACU
MIPSGNSSINNYSYSNSTGTSTLALPKGVVKEREMAATVSSVYIHVVDSVVRNLRPEFQSAGIDDSVLNEVQALWELKMMQNGAIQGPIERTSNSAPRGGNAPITPVHDLNVPYEPVEEYQTPTAEMLFPPTPLPTPIQTPLPGPPEPVMYQYFPPGPTESPAFSDSGNDPEAKIGRPAPYMHPPSTWMSQKPLGVDVNIAYEAERDEEAAGISQQPITKDFFTLSAGKRKREDQNSNYLPGEHIPQQDGAGDFYLELEQTKKVGLTTEGLLQTHSVDGSRFQRRQASDTIIAALIKAKYQAMKIPQVDGGNDNLDGTTADEDYNESTDQERQALNNIATPKASEDEEPLNDNDDDPDDLDQTDEDPKTEDLVLAQFEKVSRTKNRWKCILKNGIMHINNKDILFSKVTGEFDF